MQEVKRLEHLLEKQNQRIEELTAILTQRDFANKSSAAAKIGNREDNLHICTDFIQETEVC